MGVNGISNGVANGTPSANGTNGVNGVAGRTQKVTDKPTSSYTAKFNLPEHFKGGNSLEAAPPSDVREYIRENDGHTVITNVRKIFIPGC